MYYDVSILLENPMTLYYPFTDKLVEIGTAVLKIKEIPTGVIRRIHVDHIDARIGYIF
jgi:hypothetical protein